MTIQIWSDGENPLFLGDLHGFELTSSYRAGDRFNLYQPALAHLSLLVSQFSCRIENHSLRVGDFHSFARKNHIGHYYERRESIATDSTIYTWRGLEVNMQEYEAVFELDSFVPFDETIDPEYRERVLGPDTSFSGKPLVYTTPPVSHTVIGSPEVFTGSPSWPSLTGSAPALSTFSGTALPLTRPTTAAVYRPPEDVVENYRKHMTTERFAGKDLLSRGIKDQYKK